MASDVARPRAGFKFSHLEIIQSLRPGDLHTGRILDGTLRTLGDIPGDRIRYSEVVTKADLMVKLMQIAGLASTRAEIPILHLECHGDKSGLELTSGETVTWRELRNPFSLLNQLSGLNFLLVMASCFGGHAIDLMDITAPAPVWGVIGPDKEVNAIELRDGFIAMYSTLFRVGDLGTAIIEMRTAGLRMPIMTIEELFIRGYRIYLTSDCSPSRMKARAWTRFRRRPDARLSGSSRSSESTDHSSQRTDARAS